MDAFVDARALGGVKVAAIGPATAQVLAESKLVADLVPPEYVAESLLAAIGAPAAEGRRVLIARAAVARDVLPDGLAAAGWEVDVVEAYRTVRPEPTNRQRVELADADIVTFTSSSTVANFVTAFGLDAVPDIVACIGPITAATAREQGLVVDIEASVHTIDGLVDALLDFVVS
jgi:uroporphyrinogen III methyltransferase/synthase